MAMSPTHTEGHREGEGPKGGHTEEKMGWEKRPGWPMARQGRQWTAFGPKPWLWRQFCCAPAVCGRMLTQPRPTSHLFTWISSSPELLDLYIHTCLPLHSAGLGLVLTLQFRVQVQEATLLGYQPLQRSIWFVRQVKHKRALFSAVWHVAKRFSLNSVLKSSLL